MPPLVSNKFPPPTRPLQIGRQNTNHFDVVRHRSGRAFLTLQWFGVSLYMLGKIPKACLQNLVGINNRVEIAKAVKAIYSSLWTKRCCIENSSSSQKSFTSKFICLIQLTQYWNPHCDKLLAMRLCQRLYLLNFLCVKALKRSSIWTSDSDSRAL